MRTVTVHIPEIKCEVNPPATRRTNLPPCRVHHFAAVPAIELRGTFNFLDCLSLDSAAALYRAYKDAESREAAKRATVRHGR